MGGNGDRDPKRGSERRCGSPSFCNRNNGRIIALANYRFLSGAR